MKKLFVFVAVLFTALVLNYQSAEAENSQAIYIGDSRTVGMSTVIGDDGNIWIAKPGIGYSWMTSTAIPQAEAKMEEGMKVVIMMGVNDVTGNSTVEKYADYLNEKAPEWKEEGVDTYYVSVNPVTAPVSGGKLTNAKIEEWNESMQSLLCEDIYFIDSYNEVSGNMYASDGLHYDSTSYKMIYSSINSAISRVEFESMLDDMKMDTTGIKGSSRMKVPATLFSYTAGKTVNAYLKEDKHVTDNSGVVYDGGSNYVDTTVRPKSQSTESSVEYSTNNTNTNNSQSNTQSETTNYSSTSTETYTPQSSSTYTPQSSSSSTYVPPSSSTYIEPQSSSSAGGGQTSSETSTEPLPQSTEPIVEENRENIIEE